MSVVFRGEVSVQGSFSMIIPEVNARMRCDVIPIG